MANPKIIDLIKVIIYNTSTGKIAWKKSTEEDLFNAPLKDFSVQIAASAEWDDDSGEPYTAYRIRLFNSAGDLIAEFSPADFSKGDFDDRYPYYTFEDLHKKARSIAMGIDDAVDAILSQLSPLPVPSDDDIPF